MKNMYDLSMWNCQPTKLAILVPARDTVYTAFTSCLLELVKTTSHAGIDVHTIFDTSTILLNQREKLAEAALDINASHMLWLDSDMFFPSTTALRLLSHKIPIVAANYMKRSLPLTTVAYPKRGEWNNWLPLESQEELEPVEGVGMGCMLVKTSVLTEIPKPWFNFEYKDGSWHGEDFYFQTLCRNAGHDVMIDMNLSRQIRHIGQWAFGPNIGTNHEQIVKRHALKVKDAQ